MCIYNIYVYIYILLQPSIPYELGLSTGPPVIFGQKNLAPQVLMGGLSYGHMLTHLDLSVLTQSACARLGADRRR